MSLYSPPPPARSFSQDVPTLLVCWWCTCFAAVIIIFRVCGRYIRTEELFKEDWLAFACLIPLFTRQALVHVILLYGTNNTITTGLSAEEIYHRSTGSRLVLASRIFYAATLWMLKLTILQFLKRLTLNIWTRSHEIMLQFTRWYLLSTFIAVIIADLAECHPITHYWQVVPDPGGRCRQGYVQLLTMGTANITTDLLLVLFPIPIILRSTMRVNKKIQLVLLFALSLLPAGTTLFRIPNIINRHGSQQYRSLLASVEILFATAVANALVLGSFVRDKGLKKQRWKFGSMSDSIERRSSRIGSMAKHWGSDEDLVRDLGLGVDAELRGSISTAPRPAPMAVAGNTPVKAHKLGVNDDWHFPAERSDTSEDLDLMKVPDRTHSPGGGSSIPTPRKVSFFDVGGLLDEEGQQRRGSSTRTMDTDGDRDGESSNHVPLHPMPSHEPARRGSTAFLQDIGGLLGSRTRLPRHQSVAGYELQTIPQDHPPHNEHPPPPRPSRLLLSHQPTAPALHDVGGLLK